MRLALIVAAALCAPSAAIAQAAGGPSVPAVSASSGTARPISRATPSVTIRGARFGAAPSAPKTGSLPKATALERAEKLKIDRDMSICRGC